MSQGFPILGTRPQEYITWDCIKPHEIQAWNNHKQTLRRLAERGGLDYSEALAVIEDRPWKSMDETKAKRKISSIISLEKQI